MGQKKNKAAALETKTRLIGIGGAGHSVGCTHFAVMLLNYLAGYQRRRAALLEWNDSGDLECLEKVCKGTVRESSLYRVLDADYYKRAGEKELADALQKGYEDILIDFGAMEEVHAEFLRCEEQFIVGSFSEWQQERFREFAEKGKRAGRESWKYLAVFGSEETRKEFKRRFGIISERIPFSADAFSVTEECGVFFDRLMKGR